MDVRDALATGRRALAGQDAAALHARLLLQHLLSVDHATLVAHDQRPLTPDQERRYRAWLTEAAQGRPLPYITGEAPFYGRSFAVTPAVLIPRPETELLVEKALQWLRERPGASVVDVGTGSGCIAVTLAAERPDLRLTAVDRSDDALAVARGNAARYEVAGAITFGLGDLLEPVAALVDLIVANLPYVAADEWSQVDDGVKSYEPSLALKGGADGLALIRRLLERSPAYLRPGGAIFLEIGWRQGPAALAAAATIWPEAAVTVAPDYAGHDRLLTISTTA